MRVPHQAESRHSGHKLFNKQQNKEGNKRLGAICGLACLVWSQGGNGQGVDCPPHHVVERRVNKAVARQRRMAAKPLGHDANRKVPAAFAPSHMPCMQMRIVAHFNFAGRQCFQQPRANKFRAFPRCHLLSTIFIERTTHKA